MNLQQAQQLVARIKPLLPPFEAEVLASAPFETGDESDHYIKLTFPYATLHIWDPTMVREAKGAQVVSLDPDGVQVFDAKALAQLGPVFSCLSQVLAGPGATSELSPERREAQSNYIAAHSAYVQNPDDAQAQRNLEHATAIYYRAYPEEAPAAKRAPVLAQPGR